MTEPRPKTYKREIACTIAAIFFALLIGGIWHEGAAVAAESIKFPAFTLLMAAFGMDAISKQFGSRA